MVLRLAYLVLVVCTMNITHCVRPVPITCTSYCVVCDACGTCRAGSSRVAAIMYSIPVPGATRVSRPSRVALLSYFMGTLCTTLVAHVARVFATRVTRVVSGVCGVCASFLACTMRVVVCRASYSAGFVKSDRVAYVTPLSAGLTVMLKSNVWVGY